LRLVAIMNCACPLCGADSPTRFEPCVSCRGRIFQFDSDACAYCGVDLAGSDNPCLDCRDNPPTLDAFRAMGNWSGPLREWLSALKYGGDARMAFWLSDRLIEIHRERWTGIPVVPVPPRRMRVFHSGIDPVSKIAYWMEKRGIRVLRLLKRRGSQTQKSLGRLERLQALALKYELKPKTRIAYSEVVILDDVSTTGATLNACARVLKSAGIKRVYGMTVCKD